MNEMLVTTEFRNETVRAAYFRLRAIAVASMERCRQPSGLREAVISAAETGVWGKLNRMCPSYLVHLSDDERPVVFTGQQPTLDYGVYRRFGKRSGSHTDIMLVHTHADHDRAGKNGFGSVTVPLICEGRTVIKRYSFGVKFSDNDIMVEIPKPTVVQINAFFNAINEDHSIVNTVLLKECQDFIIDNYLTIRSLAELNSIIQTFLIRKVVPEADTIDVMLSDVLRSNVARKGLAELIAELPDWNTRYIEALRLVQQSKYSQHPLPKDPQRIETSLGVATETPLWFLDGKPGGGIGPRRKIWVIQDGRGLRLVTMNSKTSDLETVMNLSNGYTVNDVLGSQNFRWVTPGAVALTDLLRSRLGLTVIHGLTGHMYDAVTETMAYLKTNMLDASTMQGRVCNSDYLPGMSGVAAISHTKRRLPGEINSMRHSIGILDYNHEALKIEIDESNAKSKTLYKEVIQAISNAGINPEEKTNAFCIRLDFKNLENELDAISKMDVATLPESLHKAIESYKRCSETKKVKSAIEKIYSMANILGIDALRIFLNERGHSDSIKFVSLIEGVLKAKINLQNSLDIRNELNAKLKSIDESIEDLRLEMEQDVPLITAAIYHPQVLIAIRRLHIMNIKNE